MALKQQRQVADLIGPPEESGIRHCRPKEVERIAPSACISKQDFVLAIDAARNPHADAIETISAEIAEATGMLNASNRRRFDAFNTLVSFVYPEANLERAVACAEWCNWLFFFDDLHDEDIELCQRPAKVERSMRRHLSLLAKGGVPKSGDALERYSVDLHDRLSAMAGRAWLKRFCASAADYLLKGVLFAVRNWGEGRTPGLADYLIQREHDSSMASCIDMIEVGQDFFLPDEIFLHPEVQRARRACARSVGYFNDIVSFPKEVLKNHNPNNLVCVLMKEERSFFRPAVLAAARIVNDCTNEMIDASAAAQKHFGDTEPLRTYLRGLAHWQRGNIEWSLTGQRYAAPESPLVELCRAR